MIEWEHRDDRLRVVDADNAELSVRGDDLAVEGSGADVDRPVDGTVVATAGEFRFPHTVVYASSLTCDRQYELDPGGEPLSLPPDEYVVDVDTGIKTYLQFAGPATIRKTDGFDSVVVSFPERRRVTLGFRSRQESPVGTITVPPEPAALATAITHSRSAHKTDGPDRSYPTLRGHPPLFVPGEELSLPDRVRTEPTETGIELVVPPAYDPLFVVAPLAYYLGASVRTATGATPTLRVPKLGLERRLSPMPDLEDDVARLLRGVFGLDCLVRNAGPYGTRLAETDLLEAHDLDAETLYEASPARRLVTYLEQPLESITARLPDWHLSTYVAPGPASVESLPFLLDRLSLVFTPRASRLAGEELVDRALTDHYRGRQPGAGRVPSVDVVDPDLRTGRVHGWLADGVPIDVFKASTAAYHNRFTYLERTTDATSICAVLNEPEMAAEHRDVVSTCRERACERSIDLTVEESLDTATLARVFESEPGYDFVHYVGHCETDGLRCPDGYLSASSLETCTAQTFFLNACGSFYEGLELVEKGSVAGAVTVAPVLDDHALTVGSTFAKLLVHGFSIERALALARRRIVMGKDYAVVGDGTHALTQGDSRLPVTGHVERLGADRFELTLECYAAGTTGEYYVPHVGPNRDAYLCGTPSQFTLDRDELVAFLEETTLPVVYDGDLYWSTALSATV